MIPDMSLGSERPTRWMARVLMLAVIAGISFVFPVLGFAQDTTDYPYDYAADTDPAALDDFAEPLDPYGTWVDHPTYGTVWVPDRVVVGDDFQPYRTAGKWAVADDGEWVWISDYDWGYIPFHYGRWVWISGTGWAWIPGRVYAPAWVVWRTGEPGYDYIGWAPAPPAYVWFGGVAVGYYGTVTVPWWYCPSTYFFSPFWHYHVLHHHHHIHRVHAHTHHYHGHHGHHGPHGKAAGTGHHKPSGGGTHGHAKATGTEATATRRRHSNAGGGEFKRAASSHGAAGYAKYGIPKSPSFQDARVPKSAVPNKRVKHDQRAMSLRKPFTPQASRRGVTQGRPAARGATSRATRGAARRGASRTTSTHRREQPSRSVRDSRNVRRPSYPSRVRRSSRSRPQGRQAGVTPSHSRASRVRQPRRAAPSRSSRAARSANRARPPTPRASSTRTSPPRASSSPQSASRARSSARRSTRTKSSSSRSKRSRSRKTRKK